MTGGARVTGAIGHVAAETLLIGGPPSPLPRDSHIHSDWKGDDSLRSILVKVLIALRLMTVPLRANDAARPSSNEMANTSLRNLLLANIALQTDLTEHLFSSLAHASLPQPQSRSTRPVSRARPDLEAIPSLYDNLVEATKQQAELLEHARRHQKRWRQLQRKRKQAQELEDKVDKILIELNQTGTELEELVADGQHVISNIEFAEKGKSSEQSRNLFLRLRPGLQPRFQPMIS